MLDYQNDPKIKSKGLQEKEARELRRVDGNDRRESENRDAPKAFAALIRKGDKPQNIGVLQTVETEWKQIFP